MNDNRTILYNALKNEGYTDIGANQEEFNKLLENPSNMRVAYDAMVNSGYTDIGKDYEEFVSIIQPTSNPSAAQQGIIPELLGTPYPAPEVDKSQYTFTGEQLGLEDNAYEVMKGHAASPQMPEGSATLPTENRTREELLAERKRLEDAKSEAELRLRTRRGEIASPSGMYQMGMAPVTGNQATEITDPEMTKLYAAVNSYDNAIRSVDRKLSGEEPGFWEGVADATVRNPGFYTMGLTDMSDARGMLNIAQNGIEGREDELLADAIYSKNAEQQDEDFGFLYRAGNMFGHSVPFMVQTAVTGGFSGSSRAGANLAGRLGKKAAEGTIKKKIINAMGTTIDDVIEAGLIANTAGAGGTWANIAERKAGKINIKDGDYVFENGESWLGALYKGEVSSILELYTEKLGGHLEGKLSLTKGLDKIGASRVSNVLLAAKNSDLYKGASTVMRQFGLNGYLPEVLEEEANLVLNSLLVGDNSLSELYNPRTQLDIFGGMLLTVGTMQAIPGTIATAGYVKNQYQMNRADRRAADVFGEDWEAIKEALDNATNEKVAGVVSENLRDNENQNKALLDYYKRMMIMRGYNIGTVKNETAPDIEEAYTDGYSQEPTGVNAMGAVMEYNQARMDVARVLGLAEDADVDAFLNGRSAEEVAMGDADVENTIVNYQMQKARKEGLQEKFQQTREQQYEESDRIVDSNANKANPEMTYSTQLNGQPVYITGGVVVLNEDGTIDANNSSESLFVKYPDGRVEPVSLNKFTGVFTEEKTADLKAAKRAEINDRWRAEFDTAEAQAIEQEKRDSGVVFNMTDAQGNHRIEILNEGEKMSDILIDGKQEQIPTEELNSWKQEAGIQSTDAVADDATDNVAPVAPVELPEVPDFFRMNGKNYEVASRNDDGSVDVVIDGKRETLPVGTDYSTSMPTDKKGDVQYEQMPVERTHEHFVQKVTDDEARAEMIEKRRKKAEAERKKFDKKPDPGLDPDKWTEVNRKWEEGKKAAQAKVDYWNKVAKREAEITRSETREAVENIKPDVVKETAEEFIASHLPKITPESFKRETGLSNEEQSKLVGVISNEGVTIEQAAESIMENYDSELKALGFTGDMQDVRNVIIDVLSQGNPRSYAKNSREAREAENIEQQRAEAEAWGMGTFNMTLGELYVYEETLLPRLTREFEGFDEKEYYDNLAGNYENDTTRESESIGRGGEVLQGEQSVPASGVPAVGVRNEGGAVSNDVQGGGQNATPQGNQQVSGSEIQSNQNRDNVSQVEGVAEGEPVGDEQAQGTEGQSAETPYSIAPAQYTTKKGKVLDMHLVKFTGELTKEQQRAAKELAKADKGWYDREKGGFMMRTEESAKQLADTILNNDDAVSDAQPVSLADTRKIVETEQQVQPTNQSGNRLVTDERYAELRERMRKKLGGQMNIGIDPEILAIGTEMAVYHLEKGARKFTEFAKAMVADLGDAIRPYLKAFYNGARELPEVIENGLSTDMTPYDEVQTFDVANFDKPGVDAIATATAVVKEQEVEKQVEIAQERIKMIRNNKKDDKKSVNSQQKILDLFDNGAEGENAAADNSGAQLGREELPDTEQVGAGVPIQDTARNSKSKRRNAGVGSSELGNGPQYDVNRNYTNEEIEEIVSSVTDIVDGKVVITGEVTDDIKAIVRGYESGGIAKKGRGILDEYYTDGKIVDAVNLLITPYFNSSTPIRVLEPSVGIGNFIQAVNNIPTSEVVAFEINETTARIAKILYPDVDVNLRSFETEFIDESGNKKPLPKKYSLVIGNPPYGSHRGLYKGLGEESKIARYEDYFVKRSLDVLDEGGVLAMVLPSSWIDRYTKFGGYTIERAYRLPSGAFEATQVGTDIVILKKDSSVPVTEHVPYFEQFPERVLGEVKQRKGRYGRLEEYVEGDIDAAIEAIKKENAEQVADLLDIEKNNDTLNNIESAVDETGSPEKAVAIVKDAQESEKADKKPAKKPTGKQGKYKVELNRGVETVPTSAQFTHEFSEGEVEAFADTDYEGALSNPAKHRRYANYIGGQAIHDFYYAEGDIYSKLAQLKQEKHYIVENYGAEQYDKQKALLESVLPKQKSLEEITISPNTTFVKNLNILTEDGRVSLKDMFVDFLRKLPRQAFGNSSSWEVVGYINNEQVHGTDKQRNQLIRERRKRVANDLFNKFLSEELSDNAKKQVIAAFNREYNSTYRPDYSKVPMFSTINRDFKGKPLKLTSVQLAGIGRMTVKGVGVLAHEVGFGKTLSGILAMHEAMTRGFAEKPLIVVPNDNILKQWVETIGEVLPNATVNTLGNLGAGYDLTDFKVNDGEFTIITYEGLKAMSFSDYTYDHLASKFSYITEDLNKHQSERDIQKEIEKKKELKGKMKRGTKSSYMFEDFGFDWLTVDEVHNANHIVSKVRLDKSVASDFRSQSQRTSDLGLKTWLAAQYIQEENNGRNVLLLSATPFTNKPLEYYSILSLVGNDMLERKGFFNVDQFFATFMEADNELEIGANGRPTQKTNVRRFRNNGLFQQLLSEFIDIKGEEDNPELVRPERLNKEYKIAQNELTAEAMAAAQELLSDNDTVLQGIGHARAAAFSPYATSLLGRQPKNHKEFVKNSPKIDATIRMIEQNIKDRPDAGQIIYSEVGVEYFPLIRDYLVKESGLKPSEVRIITGATSNNERVNIQTAFNNGEVKVVIGSPAIKEGLNLQGNTTDMYILSLPWNFTQLRQIEGRGWRQGNRWENIRINYMLTNDSVDVFMLQRLQLKQGLYNEAMKSGAESLDVSDIDTAELKTALITDPAVRAEVVTVQERAKLQQEKTQIEADLSFVMRKYEAYNKLVEKLGSQKNTIKMYREWAKKGDEYWAQRIPREEAQLTNIENEIEEEKQSLLKKGVNVDDIVRQTEQAQNTIAAIQEKIDNLKEFQEELTQKFREESEAKAKEQGDLVSTYIKERKAENKSGFYKIRPQETETKAAEEEAEDDVLYSIGEDYLLEEKGTEAFKRATKTTMDAVERLKANGLEVEVVSQEEADAMMELAEMQKRTAPETVSVQDEHLQTVVSSADGAKVLKDLDNAINEYEKDIKTKEKTFLGRLAEVLNAKKHGSKSQYATFEAVNGKVFTIRLANHNAKVSTFDNHDENEGISIVITAQDNNGVTNDGNAHLVEFFYDAIKLRKADGKPLVEILKSIKQALYSGEYKDNTGLAVREEVNIPEMMTVFHGSGAQFDRFDHSFMNSGEGAQAFGYGTYVTAHEATAYRYGLRGKVRTQKGNLYEVEIPESGYIQWDEDVNADELRSLYEALPREKVEAVLPEEFKGEDLADGISAWSESIFPGESTKAEKVYRNISYILGSEKAASEFLNKQGYTGIAYTADGARNYVIFNENDAQIKDRVEFLRAANGKVYGWAVDGKIYLTPDGINPNSPVHEYTHLWAAAVEQRNPELWAETKEAMKLSPVWNEVMSDGNYSNIWNNENRVASEVLSRLTGRENYRRTMEQAKKEIEQAEKISRRAKIKAALKNFWNRVQNIFRKKENATGPATKEMKPWDEFVNSAIGDFYKGKNPNVKDSPLEGMFIGEKSAANLDKAEGVINEFNRTHKGALPVRIVQNFDNWKDEFREFGVKEDEISRFEERIKEGSGRPKGAYLPDADIIVIFDHSLKGRDLEGALWHENMHKAIREDNREGIPTLESALRKIFRDDFDATIKEAEEHGYIGEDAYEEIACQLVQVAYLEDKMNANGIKGRGVFQDFINPLIKKVYGREGGDIYERVLGKSEGIYEEELSGRSLASPVERKEGAGTAGAEETRFSREVEEAIEQQEENEVSIARETVTSLGEKLNSPVKIIDDLESVPENRRKWKGWFDPKTGEVVVVMPNHVSTEDAVQTVLHETVAHKGLRAVLGEKLDEFLDGVYKDASQKVKRGINDKFLNALKNGSALTVREATEEYIAELAERDFEGYRDTWNAIRQWFRNFFRNFMNMEITDGELRYLLWKNYNRMKSGPIEIILERAMEANTGTGKVMARTAETFSTVDSYNKNVKGFKNKVKEGWYDEMRSLKVAQEAIEKELDKELMDSENVYLYANHIPSINKNKKEVFDNKYLRPFTSLLKSLYEKEVNGKKLDEKAIERYTNAKHGIERNREMSVKNALTEVQDGKKVFNDNAYKSWAQERDEVRKKNLPWAEEQRGLDRVARKYGAKIRDYSGLTAIFDKDRKMKYAQISDAAYQYVADVENALGKDVKELWGLLKGMTDYSLNEAFESGMMSKATYEHIKQMYKYYVPLRGFTEQTAEDFFDYVESDHSPLNAVVKTAYGRTSEADNIFATILNMANSAIVQGSKNRLKQRLLNLAMRSQTRLLSVDNAWYEKKGDTYEPVNYPDKADEYADFEERMKDKEKRGEVVRHRPGLDIGKTVAETWNKTQHAVRVKRNGREYVVWVNGDPAMANAINGLLREEIGGAIKTVNQFRSKMVTQYSPTFVFTNLLRDVQSASIIYAVRRGTTMLKEFEKNVASNATDMIDLYLKHKRGTLDVNNPKERYFKEFLENGGETGYTEMISIEEYEKKLKELTTGLNMKNGTRRAFEAVGGAVDFANRCVENLSRFSAYQTSREAGISILKSIEDAKEVSVNFNRKGSGAMGQKYAKAGFMFLNPAVQSIAQRILLTKKYPKKMTAVWAGEFILGAAMPVLYSIISAALGDDDDEITGNYYNLSDYRRRSSLCLPLKDGVFHIPLSHESRVLFGLGELCTSFVMGHEKLEDVPIEALNTLAQSLPLNPVEGWMPGKNIIETMTYNFMPDAVKPIAEVVMNRDFAGNTVHNRTDFNEFMPEYMRGKRGTLGAYKKISKYLTSTDGYEKSFLNNLLGGALNPSVMEHLVEGYLGGPYTLVEKVAKAGAWAFGNEEYAEFRNIPIASSFYTSLAKYEDTPTEVRTRRDWENAFRFYKDEVKGYDDKEKTAKNGLKYGEEGADLVLEQMERNGEVLMVDIFNDGNDRLKELYGASDAARKNRDFKRVEDIDQQIYAEKRNIVSLMEQLADDPMVGYTFKRNKIEGPYGERETYGDVRDVNAINDFQKELKPIIEEREKSADKDKYQKQYDLWKDLENAEEWISNRKSEMKKKPEKADELMTKIREKRAEAIELINNYRNNE